MIMTKSASPVCQLLRVVWDYCNTATGHSRTRLDRSMYSALTLAVKAGLPFGAADFVAAVGEFGGGRWLGSDGGERLYAVAVAENNLSAAMAYETWIERPPFIGDGVFDRRSMKTRQRGRLAIGLSFLYGEYADLKVTSFDVDGEYLTACLYPPDAMTWDGYSRTSTRRFRISREDLIADRKRRQKQF